MKLDQLAHRYFNFLLDHRRLTLWISALVVMVFSAFLPTLTKDTTAEAFVPKNSPALELRDRVADLFGLGDPMVLAVIAGGPNGIYTPETLALIDWLSYEVLRVEGIDPDRVTSLATQNDLRGSDGGLEVTPFWDQLPTTSSETAAIRAAVEAFPLLQGTLVSRDGSGSLIIAEMVDEERATPTYFALLELVERAVSENRIPSDVEVHVAGQGAVSGYLAAYIDADAMRLNPIAALIISLVLFLCYRSWYAVLLPNIVVLGTVAVGLGSMAAAGVPMYVITGSLPAILIGIAVCDSIHLFGAYYQAIAERPDISARDATLHACTRMWRPVILTTLTTCAGFLGLAAAAGLPPMQAYGSFAAIGVLAAGIWSLSLLPVLMSMIPPRASPKMLKVAIHRNDAALARLGALLLKRQRWVLGCGVALLALAVVGASRVEFNEQRIDAFNRTTPLHIADTTINERFDGTYYLDVLLSTPAEEDLFKPEIVARIAALQDWMVRKGGFVNTTSYVDYLKQMHRVIDVRDANDTLPDSAELAAQYFLLYTASGAPDDFEEWVDYDYRLAHIRGQLKTDNFQLIGPIVEDLKHQLSTRFNDAELSGEATGAVDLAKAWLSPLAANTAQGVVLALLLVWGAAALFFRSVVLGLIAAMPVAFAVSIVFAVMGFSGIWLGVGTSMFAAIAIGLGVDFAIHTVDRLKTQVQEEGLTPEQAIPELFTSTGRALWFNLLALALGFGVLMTSAVPPLQNFGLLVAVAVIASFITSLSLMIALLLWVRPKSIFGDPEREGLRPASGIAVLAVACCSILFASTADAQELPDANEVMAAVDTRDEGITQRASIRFVLTDRRDKSRVQETLALRQYEGRDKKQVLFYLEPSSVRGTGFLTYDYDDPGVEDEQWLYLPALRRTRRISAADRGDAFLGTDLSYEDLKRPGKVSLTDWDFTTVAVETLDGIEAVVIEGLPSSQRVADELGYSRGKWWVNPANATLIKTQSWDLQGNHARTAVFTDIREIEGIWTTHLVRVENHKTGHQTELTFSDIQYGVSFNEELFTERALPRGYRE